MFYLTLSSFKHGVYFTNNANSVGYDVIVYEKFDRVLQEFPSAYALNNKKCLEEDDMVSVLR